MKVTGVINADGTSATLGVGVSHPDAGVYSISVAGIPKARRRVRVDLLWNGGTSNNLVAQYSPEYSSDTTVVILVSGPGNPGTKANAAIAFDVELTP